MSGVWLNHAGTSWPKPAPVHAAVAEALAASPDTFAVRFEGGRAALARHLGVADPERVLITPGATSAIALGIGDLPWERGDTIAVGATDHHAVYGPAWRLRDRGVRVEVIPVDDQGRLDLDALEWILDRERVRLVAVAWASNVTGAIVDAARVLALAHAHDALVLLDAAQVAGLLPLELDALGADLVAIAGHKGPQGPQGIGALVRGWRVPDAAPSTALREPGPPPPGPTGFCDAGSVNLAGLAGLVAGFDWLAAQGGLDEKRHRQVGRLLEALPGVLGPRDPRERAGLVTFRLAEEAPADTGARLAAAGIHVSAGRHCAPAAHLALGTLPDGAVRASVGPMTEDADVEALLDVIGQSSVQPGPA